MIRTHVEDGALVVQASANGGGVWHEVDRLTPASAGALQRDLVEFVFGQPTWPVDEVRATVVMPAADSNERIREQKAKTLARVVHTAFGGHGTVFVEGRLVEYDPKAPGGGG